MDRASCEPSIGAIELVYLYDGTLEGFLSAVFEAYRRREFPVQITVEHNLQQSLVQSYIPIETDQAKALRVQKGIVDSLGYDGYTRVKTVFLSDDGAKGGIIYRFIRYALPVGTPAMNHLARPEVAAFEKIHNAVNLERSRIMQFLRFARMENGVFFARINPNANVVPLVMNHFAARFNTQPFLIYDAVHNLAGVYDRRSWWLVSAPAVDLPDNAEEEDGYQALWQTFYDTVAIPERTNHALRRSLMPKRFWGTMCEMVPPALRTKSTGHTVTPSQVAKTAAREIVAGNLEETGTSGK